MISTRDLSLLPALAPLERLCQSLAMLDAIIEPEWEFRNFSFDAHWGAGESLASMRNSSGDDYFVLFSRVGAILKGFVHESEMSPYLHDPPRIWPGVLGGVPESFASFLTEPAFKMSDATFCIWRTHDSDAWHRGRIDFPEGEDADGSAHLLALLDGKPETYQKWAEEYYERPIAFSAVEHIYAYQPLKDEIIRLLNPSLSREDIEQDLVEIGYSRANA